MKYLITESKLEQAIYQYIDKLFASENGNTEIHKLEGLDSDGNPVEGTYDFVNDDYYDGNLDYLFAWTDKEYYEKLTPNYITQDEFKRLSQKAVPIQIPIGAEGEFTGIVEAGTPFVPLGFGVFVSLICVNEAPLP